MKKTYTYYKEFTAAQGTEISVTVELVSDGNFGSTYINIPGDDDKTIMDGGTCSLGMIENLLDERTVVVSNYLNPLPLSHEDSIRIRYSIRGDEEDTFEHFNLKSEADDVVIIIIINFGKR